MAFYIKPAERKQTFMTRITIILMMVMVAITTTVVRGQSTNNQHLLTIEQHRVSDHAYQGSWTNDLACEVWISYIPSFREGQTLPTCIVSIVNRSTNNLMGYLRLPAEALYYVELFDSAGRPVQKTDFGQKFGTWKAKQIGDWEAEQFKENYGRHEFFFIISSNKTQYRSFGLSQVFQIKRPGKYTLHLQMRLVKNGHAPPKSLIYYETWLPAVIAPVEIRPEDVPRANSLPGVQTNLPAK